MKTDPRFLPTSKKEIEIRGWDYVDVVLFSGDAYIDHPSFGTAVIGRTLEAEGLRVAIVPQPNWRDDLRDFTKFGKPRLFFAVTAGAMDSMVNKYTATKRLRSEDAYTPDGRVDMRPDYPTITYTSILKKLYPDSMVIIGGIEASLRRLTHYDYWQDRLRPSFLIESGADILVYGMGEKTMAEIARRIPEKKEISDLRQLSYISSTRPAEHESWKTIELNSFEQCLKSKKDYAENFRLFENETASMTPARLIEKVEDKWVVVNPAYPYFTEEEMDRTFSLPYTRLPHPRYDGKSISAYEMIKNSVNIHRGCFGGCSFCAISAHQGKHISSRSEKSILEEVKSLSRNPEFKGTLSDIGGPSANMWRMGGKDKSICMNCRRHSCLFPKKCLNLQDSHGPLLDLYRKIERVDGIKHFYIGSGIRYDLFDGKTPYLEEVVTRHTSGRLKVAPEHTEDDVLKLMRKSSWNLFLNLQKDFHRICDKHGLPYQLVPYFISAHPGCSLRQMTELQKKVENLKLHIEPVQDFTPTPMTLSTTMYYTGIDPYSGEKVYVDRDIKSKNTQKELFFTKKNSYGNKRISSKGSMGTVRRDMQNTPSKFSRRKSH